MRTGTNTLRRRVILGGLGTISRTTSRRYFIATTDDNAAPLNGIENCSTRRSYLQLTGTTPRANLFRFCMVLVANSPSVFQGTIIQSTHASSRPLGNYPNSRTMKIRVEVTTAFSGLVSSNRRLEEESEAARRLAISLMRIVAQISQY